MLNNIGQAFVVKNISLFLPSAAFVWCRSLSDSIIIGHDSMSA